MVDDADDPKVKDLVARRDGDDIDPATRAQLERWFGLPSYEQVAEEAARRPPADPELVAMREAKARAIAAVDPALTEALYARGAYFARAVVHRPIKLGSLDPTISAFDPVLLARAEAVEPRVADIPMGIGDDLAECTPQAVLRDLHRPEIDFPLRLEVDPGVAQLMPVDGVAEVRAAMARRTAFDLPEPALRTTAAAMEPLRRAKREPWSEIRTPGRTVTE